MLSPEIELRDAIENILHYDLANIPKDVVCRRLVQAIQATRAIAKSAGDEWVTASEKERGRQAIELAILDLERRAQPVGRI